MERDGFGQSRRERVKTNISILHSITYEGNYGNEHFFTKIFHIDFIKLILSVNSNIIYSLINFQKLNNSQLTVCKTKETMFNECL